MTPLVSGLAPEIIEPFQRARVTIQGSNFVASAGDGSELRVYVDAQEMHVISVTDTQIVAETPPLAGGTYDVRIENPGGATATLPVTLRVEGGLAIPLVQSNHVSPQEE